MTQGTLYLIPSVLGPEAEIGTIPPATIQVIDSLREYLAEDARTVRRFFARLPLTFPLRDRVFHELSEHTTHEEVVKMMARLKEGISLGVVTEAGCPGIADPGAEAVRLAHEWGVKVVPLVGPSSILLALMASGMNGQGFAFSGYLPIEKSQRQNTLRLLERLALEKDQTQIFMETPYRNNAMLGDILTVCRPTTRLCVAVDLTMPSEFAETRSISDWKKKTPDLHKRPAMFLMGR